VKVPTGCRLGSLIVYSNCHAQIKLNKGLDCFDIPEPKATLCDLALACSGWNANTKPFRSAFCQERNVLPWRQALSCPHLSRKLHTNLSELAKCCREPQVFNQQLARALLFSMQCLRGSDTYAPRLTPLFKKRGVFAEKISGLLKRHVVRVTRIWKAPRRKQCRLDAKVWGQK